MANRQINPNGAYMMGYSDAEIGSPPRKFHQPYIATQRDYDNGYRAAKQAERSPQ